MASACEFGIGYKSENFAGTTATEEQAKGLAAIASFGEADDAPYKYEKATEEQVRPCDYPIEIDAALRHNLRLSEDWGQARGMVQMQACQIARTGFCGKTKASPEVRQWAKQIDAGARAKEMLNDRK